MSDNAGWQGRGQRLRGECRGKKEFAPDIARSETPDCAPSERGHRALDRFGREG